jgi:NAD(P)H-dependent FMN reductase
VRYYAQYTDEDAVYGEVGRLWCQHDLQHLINWAALDVAGAATLDTQVAWLARVLESRQFPILRLARSLELAGEVVLDELGEGAAPMAEALSGAARMVRERRTFLG